MQWSDLSSLIQDEALRLGALPEAELNLAGSAGSARMYFRLKGSTPLVCMFSPLDEDFDRFVRLSQGLSKQGLRVPQVWAVDAVRGQILLEDLGPKTLLDALGQDLDSAQSLYSQSLAWLVEFQKCSGEDFAGPVARPFGEQDLSWERNYFYEHYFCGALGLGTADWQNIEKSLLNLSARVESHPRCLMHRDFQSQNLMPTATGMAGIDYQGARWGSMWYDLASLLWDPYVCMPMLQMHPLFVEFCGAQGVDSQEAWPMFIDAAIHRLMQACGAYANLSRNCGKPQFADFLLPGGVQLCQALRACDQDPQLAQLADLLEAQFVSLPQNHEMA
jgi:N-acetylmuramate 1-kinase